MKVVQKVLASAQKTVTGLCTNLEKELTNMGEVLDTLEAEAEGILLQLKAVGASLATSIGSIKKPKRRRAIKTLEKMSDADLEEELMMRRIPSEASDD